MQALIQKNNAIDKTESRSGLKPQIQLHLYTTYIMWTNMKKLSTSGLEIENLETCISSEETLQNQKYTSKKIQNLTSVN